jgi:hypothetical protein
LEQQLVQRSLGQESPQQWGRQLVGRQLAPPLGQQLGPPLVVERWLGQPLAPQLEQRLVGTLAQPLVEEHSLAQR